ncbi:hypothetical protein NHL50_09320 [Acidimicrobiia bacterium EGI L10123]|uniref:hypothetical protein n=1 Tax=Salinilacustrithrix flava TaxID=2957203 RepID=UPI003D7C1F8D|nr:hypothetical protein [Acidimicrobiia bacterium EGI L10123]
MTAPILRLIVRSAALLALAFGFVVGSAGFAGAQLPELPAPGGEEAPDGEETPEETPTPDGEGESPLPEELDPVLDPLQPVLDQIPGADAPEDGEDPAEGTDGTETEGDAATPAPASPSAAGAATLPRTGGTVAIGFAGAAAAAGLVLRRLLRV